VRDNRSMRRTTSHCVRILFCELVVSAPAIRIAPKTMIEYRINLAGIQTFDDDFIAAFSTGFINSLGVEWNGNMDSFNDYFYWPKPHPYAMELVGWNHCMSVLKTLIAPNGQNMLSVVQWIIAANPQAVVKFA
jgi:hypothetical protein